VLKGLALSLAQTALSQALRPVGNLLGGLLGNLLGNARGNVFTNGHAVPFAAGGSSTRRHCFRCGAAPD